MTSSYMYFGITFKCAPVSIFNFNALLTNLVLCCEFQGIIKHNYGHYISFSIIYLINTVNVFIVTYPSQVIVTITINTPFTFSKTIKLLWNRPHLRPWVDPLLRQVGCWPPLFWYDILFSSIPTIIPLAHHCIFCFHW